jgi:hypothetical protein
VSVLGVFSHQRLETLLEQVDTYIPCGLQMTTALELFVNHHSECDTHPVLDMLANLLPILLFLVLFPNHRVSAQANAIGVGPLLSCTLTTFSCPGVSGCCTIAGCCGSGCCANGYTCINEGTSAQACCPVGDPTNCGTATPVSFMEHTVYYHRFPETTLTTICETGPQSWI